MNSARAISSALIGSALALLPACASDNNAPNNKPAPRLGLDVGRSASVDGVELRWWTANDNADAVTTALAALVEPDSVLPARLAARWDESGLRIARLKREALGELLETAPPVSQYARDWKGWMGAWLPVFRGRAIDRRAPFTIDNRPRMLGPGAPRILMRAWPAPTAQGPVVRLDLALQFVDEGAPRANDQSAGLIPATAAPVNAGDIIHELTAELALDPAYLYILTCESPAVVWNNNRAPAAADQSARTAAGPGPAAASPTTIGQLLFAFSLADSAQKRRIIVLIVPELAPDFALLPPRNPQ
ncbi:MAG: hypothetical protein KDA16_12040 [Phycisphaerales bacterium]|nr:hypothetical protein [Phycisphaerales bacterium]